MGWILSLVMLMPSPLSATIDCMKIAHSDPDAWHIVELIAKLDKALGKASPNERHSIEFTSSDDELVERLQKADKALDNLRDAFKADPKKL